MRRRPSLGLFCCCLTVLAGCAKSDTEGAADTVGTAAAAAEASPPAGKPLSLADVAGTWDVRSIPETGDTTPTTFRLVAKSDTAGWTFTFPNRKPIPMRVVEVAGDSVVTDAGPFESARRKGVQARTRVVWRLQGDRLVGTTVARYVTSGPDSVLRLRSEGTRAP